MKYFAGRKHIQQMRTEFYGSLATTPNRTRKWKGVNHKMLDMPTAMQVTEACIRDEAKLYPATDYPLQPDDQLLRIGIDDTRIDRLKARIAGDKTHGLPSLTPKRKIDLALLDFDESSTIVDVFSKVWRNTVLA